MTDFFELAENRYSVRKYKAQPVEPEKIARILDAGRLAPTAHNNQPQRIKVITAADELEKMDICTRCRFGAPAALLICYDKDAVWTRPFDGADSGEVDSSIITTFMMMEAQQLGLGSCWVMYFDPAKTKEQFDLPENIVPVAFLPLGYPADDAEPSPMHGKRFALADTLLK